MKQPATCETVDIEGTIARMRRAAPELAERWTALAPEAGTTPKSWVLRSDCERLAWIFEKLSAPAMNRRRIPDWSLVNMAIGIDAAMLACCLDRDPLGEIKRAHGELADVSSVAEYENWLAVAAYQFQPQTKPPATPPGRKSATLKSDEDYLLDKLQKAKNSSQRADALVRFRRRVGFAEGGRGSEPTKHNELKWLIARLEAGSDHDNASLHLAWYGVSRYTRQQVALNAYRNGNDIRTHLILSRPALLAACRAALGTPAFSKRPLKIAERVACDTIRRCVEEVSGPRSWYFNERGKLVEKAGVGLARCVAKKYEIEFSERHFKRLRGV